MSLKLKQILLIVLIILFVAGIAVPLILNSIDKITFSASSDSWEWSSGFPGRIVLSIDKVSATADGKDTINGSIGYYWTGEWVNPCLNKVDPASVGASPSHLRPLCGTKADNSAVPVIDYWGDAYWQYEDLFFAKSGAVIYEGNDWHLFNGSKFWSSVINTLKSYPNNIYSCNTGKVNFSINYTQPGKYDIAAGYRGDSHRSEWVMLALPVTFTAPGPGDNSTPTPTPTATSNPKVTKTPTPKTILNQNPNTNLGTTFHVLTIDNYEANAVLASMLDKKDTTFSGTATPNTHFRLVLHSDITVLGETTSNSDGKWTLTVPADNMISGEHTLAYQIADSSGSFGSAVDLSSVKIAAKTISQDATLNMVVNKTSQVTSSMLYTYILVMLILAVGIGLLFNNIRKTKRTQHQSSPSTS